MRSISNLALVYNLAGYKLRVELCFDMTLFSLIKSREGEIVKSVRILNITLLVEVDGKDNINKSRSVEYNYARKFSYASVVK